MNYTTFAFYRDVYRGTLDEDEFCRCVARAGYVLEAITHERVKSLYPGPPAGAAERISMATCILVDGIARTERTEGRTVTLEAVGKYRVGYAKPVAAAARSLRREVEPCLAGVRDAFGTPLLYRGAGRELGA